MDEYGGTSLGHGRQDRENPLRLRRRGEPIRRHAEAGGAIRDRLLDDVDLALDAERRRRGGPPAQPGGQRARVVLPRGQDGESVPRRQGLEPDGRGQGNERPVHVERALTLIRVMLSRIDGEPRLPLELDPPAAVFPDCPLASGTSFEHAENTLRPQMLMEVE